MRYIRSYRYFPSIVLFSSLFASGAFSTPTLAAADQPDLVVTDIRLTPTQPYARVMVHFSAVVTNQGTTPTPEGTIIDGIFKLNGSTVAYTDDYSSSLAPGASVTVTANGGGIGDGTRVAQGCSRSVGKRARIGISFYVMFKKREAQKGGKSFFCKKRDIHLSLIQMYLSHGNRYALGHTYSMEVK